MADSWIFAWGPVGRTSSEATSYSTLGTILGIYSHLQVPGAVLQTGVHTSMDQYLNTSSFGLLILLLTLPVCLVLPRKHPNDSGDFAKFRDGAEAKFDVRVGNAYGPEARKALAMEIPRNLASPLYDGEATKIQERRKDPQRSRS